MIRRRRLAWALGIALVLAGPAAQALPSWTLDLDSSGGNWDRPVFVFANTSTAGEAITDLSISIGDTSYHWDFVAGTDPSEAATGATLLSPDRTNNNWWAAGGRSDVLSWSFSDFQAGEALTFTADLDFDWSFGSSEDARSVLFNNDGFFWSDPNALVSATFSDGSVASLTLPDGAGTRFSFSSPGAPASVAEPSALLLAACGLLGLARLGRGPRRKRAPRLDAAA
jgi:hypothetical protein